MSTDGTMPTTESASSAAAASDADQHNSAFLQAIQRILLSTAFLTAISFYIGWLGNAAYYVTFGIMPSLVQKPFAEVLASGWVEIVLLILIFVAGAFFYYSLGVFFDRPISRSGKARRWMTVLFLVLLFLAMALGLYGVYLLVFFRISFRSLVWGFSALGFYMLSAVVGYHLRTHWDSNDSGKMKAVVQVLVPSFLLHLGLALILSIFLCSRVGIARGVYLANRDIHSRGNLPIVTVYSDERLSHSGSFDPVTSLYAYADYRLVAISDGYMYLLRKPSLSSKSATNDGYLIYVLSMEKVDGYELER